MNHIIKFNSLVKMNYSIESINKIVFESTFESKPVVIRIGNGLLPQKLEMTLYGLEKNAKQTMYLEAQDAFGLRDERNFHTLKKDIFPDKEMIKVGNIIEAEVENNDKDSKYTFAKICKINNNDVIIDLNHPLAGHKIIFKVHILDINE